MSREVLSRENPRLRALLWQPRCERDGQPCVALLSDAGRQTAPSQMRRRVATHIGEHRVVVRYLPEAEVRRPPTWRLLPAVARVETLVGSALPVVLGLAVVSAPWGLTALALVIGTLAVHIGANLVGEAYEHVELSDGLLRPGGSKVLQRGWMSARRVLLAGAVLLAMGAGLGAWALGRSGHWEVAGAGALGLLAGWQFAAPPLRLRRTLLAEPTLFLLFGPLLTAGVAYAIAGAVPTAAWIAGAIAGGVTLLRRLLRGIRRLPDDAILGYRPLTVRLGFNGGRVACWLAATSLVIGPALAWASGHAPIGVLGASVAGLPLFWALGDLRRAFAPHDPRLTRAARRLNLALPPYALALALGWIP